MSRGQVTGRSQPVQWHSGKAETWNSEVAYHGPTWESGEMSGVVDEVSGFSGRSSR